MASVLVVDDDETFRKIVVRAVQRMGHEVAEAKNGVEAIECFERHALDLLITDVLMPEKDGIETIRAVRKKWPTVRIIAMSGGGRVEPARYLQMAEAVGVWDTLAKPFSKSELEMLIVKVLAG
jgi:CheY-like chemotaxis protein